MSDISMAVEVLTSVAEQNLLQRGDKTTVNDLFDQTVIRSFLMRHKQGRLLGEDELDQHYLSIGGYAELAVQQAERFCFAATTVMPHTVQVQRARTLQRSLPLATCYGRVAEIDFDQQCRNEGSDTLELIDQICAEPKKNFEYVPRVDQVFFSKDCWKFLATLITEDSGCPARNVQLGEGPEQVSFFQFLWRASVRDFVANDFVVRFANTAG